MSFTIKCNECGSTDVTLCVKGTEYDPVLLIECNNCNYSQEEYKIG